MSEFDTNIPTTFDPFDEANAEDSGVGARTKEYVHVRVQQRNGRKSLTNVQGLKKEFSYSKILKDLKKEFCCNSTVVEDPELGQVIYSYLNAESTWQTIESWHWKPFPRMHSDTWGYSVLPPPQAQCFSYTRVRS